MLISCDVCGKTLKVPDSAAGKRAKCPSCSNLIAVPDTASGDSEAAASPRRERSSPRSRPTSDYDSGGLDFGDADDWEDADPWDPPNPYAAPRPQAAASESGGQRTAGLSTVGTGLLIQAWSIAAIILTTAGLFFFALVAAGVAGPGRGGMQVFTGVVGLGGLTILAATLGVLVGEFFCLATPERTGARGLIIATIVCLSVQLTISIASNVLRGELDQGTLAVLGMFSGIAGLAHFVCYLLFQKTIANYIGRHDLAGQAQIILMGMGLCLGAMIVMSVLGVAVRNAPIIGLLSLVIVIPAGIAVIVFAVMQLFLLFRLGSALRG
jgi:hypothetical protein